MLSAFGARLQVWFDLLERRAREISREAGAEVFAFIRAERSDFVRFNHARVRQAGTVERQVIELRLIDGRRVATGQYDLSGQSDDDRLTLDRAFDELRGDLRDAQPDPYLLLSEVASESFDVAHSDLPAGDELQRLVAQSAAGRDLVGAYMGGPILQALWSSRGHRHVFERTCWSFDFSLYLQEGRDELARNKAVKSTVGGANWGPQLVSAAIGEAAAKLEVLRRPSIVLEPGAYRALLSPAAVAELLDLMCWGGFSARSQSTGQSPLARWRSGLHRVSSRVNLVDDLDQIGVACFQADGFVRPRRIELIRAGQPGELYCSPRSATEFSMESNGAHVDESAQTLSLAAGTLPRAQALAKLGTGIDVSNLWYLNFSDRANARVTGMTRFACLWVENGQWQAPIEPMRFDDSLPELFGDRLVDLGDETVWMPELASYDWRGNGGKRAPSALVSLMRFTL